MAKQVQANKDGFYAGRRYRAGEQFTLPDGARVGKWMTPVQELGPSPKAKGKVKGKAATDEVETFSELAQRDGKALSIDGDELV